MSSIQFPPGTREATLWATAPIQEVLDDAQQLCVLEDDLLPRRLRTAHGAAQGSGPCTSSVEEVIGSQTSTACRRFEPKINAAADKKIHDAEACQGAL